jgi:hypothetical protein
MAARPAGDEAMQGDGEFLPPDLGALGAQIERPAEDNESAVSAVLAQHHDALMARSGVVMLGETLDAVGRPAILIGVKTRKGLARLPEQLDGVPVVIQVIGEVDAQ